jgi:hypothetical protein
VFLTWNQDPISLLYVLFVCEFIAKMAFDLAAAANATSEQKLDMLLAAVSTLLQGQEKSRS